MPPKKSKKFVSYNGHAVGINMNWDHRESPKQFDGCKKVVSACFAKALADEVSAETMLMLCSESGDVLAHGKIEHRGKTVNSDCWRLYLRVEENKQEKVESGTRCKFCIGSPSNIHYISHNTLVFQCTRANSLHQHSQAEKSMPAEAHAAASFSSPASDSAVSSLNAALATRKAADWERKPRAKKAKRPTPRESAVSSQPVDSNSPTFRKEQTEAKRAGARHGTGTGASPPVFVSEGDQQMPAILTDLNVNCHASAAGHTHSSSMLPSHPMPDVVLHQHMEPHLLEGQMASSDNTSSGAAFGAVDDDISMYMDMDMSLEEWRALIGST